jgi:hypothetical protein
MPKARSIDIGMKALHPMPMLQILSLYFTSNRDGGFGNSDIYVAEKIYTQKK